MCNSHRNHPGPLRKHGFGLHSPLVFPVAFHLFHRSAAVANSVAD